MISIGMTHLPDHKSRISWFLRMWILPPIACLGAFCILTYPLIRHFRTHYFSELGDGLQNAWNLWWIDKAVTELHQNPYFTTWLHYPDGTSLLGHTLGLFNGLLGIALQRFLTMNEAYNLIIVFAFTAAGYTAFRLAFHLTDSYWSSLAAGYLFTFSQYHFAHAVGHMNLVSIEWIPLFILCWYRLIVDPGPRKAVFAAIALSLVLLSDNYYFLYGIFSVLLIVLWHAQSSRDYLFLFRKKHLLPLTLFTGISLTACGPLLLPLLRIIRTDPFTGAHDPMDFSLDLGALFIPGGHSRFAGLTESYWSQLPGNIQESSVYLGVSVWLLILFTWLNRRRGRLQFQSFNLWFLLLLFFGVMALGPALQLSGKPLYTGLMPYTMLQVLVPPIRVSGVPVRMTVMVTLAAAMITAMGLKMLLGRRGRFRLPMSFILGAVMIVELLPGPLPASAPVNPPYLDQLSALPPTAGLMDTVNPTSIALYLQTRHGLPLADGYISRYPSSVFETMKKKYKALDTGDFQTLIHNYRIEYLLTAAVLPDPPCTSPYEVLYDAGGVRLYRFQPLPVPLEPVEPEILEPTAEYLGYIDSFDGRRLSGWALIPDTDATDARISIIVSREAGCYRIPVCREIRPDVSAFHQRENLYDASGFKVDFEMFDVPEGIYQIAVCVENGGARAIGVSAHQLQTSALGR